MKLLLISNGFYGGRPYLDYAKGWTADHFGASIEKPKTLLFVPYAKKDGDAYVKQAEDALGPLGIRLLPTHRESEPAKLLENVDGVFIPGGNTFRLLDRLQKANLVELIREKILSGMPYMGVSAGTNIAAPTMMTTNDMPIARPKDFDTFGFVPFQINPHFVLGKFYHDEDGKIVPYNGETRPEKIAEYHGEDENNTPVLGLREGTALRIRGASIELLGGRTAFLFVKGEDKPREIDNANIATLAHFGP